MRLKNNRYRVLTPQGWQEVFADHKEDACKVAMREGLAVRKVVKVQSLTTLAARKAAMLAVLLLSSVASAEVDCNSSEALNDFATWAMCQPSGDTRCKDTKTAEEFYRCAAGEAINVEISAERYIIPATPPAVQPDYYELPDGRRCKPEDWNIYFQLCRDPYDPDAEAMVPGEALEPEEEEDMVLMPVDQVFHPNGQLFQEHWEACKVSLCRAELAELSRAYGWYLEHYGADYDVTRHYYDSAKSKERECGQ